MKEEEFFEYEEKFLELLNTPKETFTCELMQSFALDLEGEIKQKQKTTLCPGFMEVFYDFVLLSLCYYCSIISSCDSKSAALKKDIIDEMRVLKLYGVSENLEDYIDNEINIEDIKTTKHRLQFENFIQNGICDDKYFKENICIYISIISKSVDLKISVLPFMRFCSFVSDFKGMRKIFNKTVFMYFRNYIELTRSYKTTMHENLKRLDKKCAESIDSSNIMKIVAYESVSAEELKSYFYFGHLFFKSDDNEKEREQFEALEIIFNKVFFNEHKYVFNEIREKEIPMQHREIFLNTAELFYNEFRENYGVAICLFLLLSEIGFDDFLVLFPKLRPELSNETDKYYLTKVPIFLQQWHDLFDHSGNIDMKKLFSPYEEKLKRCLLKQSCFVAKQWAEHGNFQKIVNEKIIPAILFFAIFNICGSYNVDVYSIKNKDEGIEKKAVIEKPFYDAIKDGSWMTPKKQFEIYNKVAKEFNFQGFDFEKTFPFSDFSNKDVKDNWALVNLIYALTRRQVDSKEFLYRQMNLLREKQKIMYPFKKKNKTEFSNIHKAKYSQVELSKIDKGFKINSFIQNLYPFSSQFFVTTFRDTMLLKREVVCKFINESDYDFIETDNSRGVLDFSSMNKKALSTRYLYKDRNMSNHFALHSSVDNLLKPTNWKNLIYALCDFQEEVLLKIYDKDFEKHDYIYNRHRDNPIFFVYHYLNDEIIDLLRILRNKLCEAANVPFVLKENEEGMREYYDNFLKKIEGKKISSLDYSVKKSNIDGKILDNSDNLFLPRLKNMLNIMFAVNGSNEDGYEHNSSVLDFYNRYYAEIAFYLFYLTIKFTQADNNSKK